MTDHSSLKLSKFEVAERQLNQAIELFFDGGDPVSVHTLAEAAAQVLFDIRKKIGAVSQLRESDRIRPEYRLEWIAELAKSRNFFKHADRDGDATHEFKEEFNHFSIMDGVSMLLAAKKQWTPETIVFLAWFAAKYPHAVVQGNDFSSLVNRYRAGLQSTDSEHRKNCGLALKELRTTRKLPGVSTSIGLPANDG
jgi:hypothetical protein